MRPAGARMVRLHERMLTETDNGGYMYEPWPCHFKLPITSFFGQEHKVWVLIFLVRTRVPL